MTAVSLLLRMHRARSRQIYRLAIALATLHGRTAFAQDPSGDFDYCLLCHGTQARGNAAIGAPNLSVLEPEYLRRQLEAYSTGWRGTHERDPYGTEMQPIAALLDGEQIKRAAAYVSHFEPVWPRPTVTGNAERGSDLYSQCAACHGSAGEGNMELGAPRLSGQSDWYLLRQIDAYRSGWRGANPDDSSGRQMRALAQTLDEDAALDLIAFVNTLVPEDP